MNTIGRLAAELWWKLGWFLACLCFSRSFAEERSRNLSCRLGIWRLGVGEFGVALVVEERIFLVELVAEQLAVAVELGSMGSMVEQQVVAQHRLVVRMGSIRQLVFALVVEHKLVVAEQLVLVAGQLFSLAKRFVSWQR